MLKREELAILDRAIGQLTPESYLGPWLQSVRAEVFANMTSDLEPAMLPAEAYARAHAMIESARSAVAELEAQAHVKADRLIEETRKRCDDYRSRTRRELEKLAGQV